MRRGKLASLFLCTALVMTGAGCSKTAEVAQTGQPAAQNSTTTSQPAAGQNTAATSDAKNTAGVIAKVTSINGSTVVLALAQMPQGGSQPGGQPPAGQPGSGQAPAKEPSQGGAPPADSQKQPSVQLTGESKTITIPSSAKIVGGGKDASTQLSISDIKVGDMIEIKYSTTDSTVIEQISIIKAPAQ
ncbi:MAG: hypothetical protein ABRQ26_04060 [Syntrophomonadaceae bacterium]